MSDPIASALSALPSRDVTVRLLELLDFVVPGEWDNITDMTRMIEEAVGETNPHVVARLTREAERVYADPDARYATARWLFETVDTLDKLASAATVANKVGGLFGGALDFLEEFTPKPETTQSIDAGVKLVVELVAFGMIRGVPEDASFEQIADFVIALQDYAKSDVMRIGAWIVVDGLLPLGPDFMVKITETIRDAADSTLSNNKVFDAVSNHIPGDGVEGKRSFILQALAATSTWIGEFVAERGLTRELIVDKISEVVEVTEDTLDYVAAGLDASTNYFTHTGVQTVAREVVLKAHADLKEQVWREWVDGLG